MHAPGAAEVLKTQLAKLTRQVEEGDARIRAAATPRKMHFELIPTP